MKLVQFLRSELKEWADTTVCYVQDPDGSVWPCKETAFRYEGRWSGDNGLVDQRVDAKHFEDISLCIDHETAIVTKEQWQAERDRQKGGEWKRHRGGKQPVAGDVRVEVKLRCGDIQQYEARAFAWPHTSCDVDANIMQYRVISQPQAEEVEYRGPFHCAPIGDYANIIEYDIEFPSGVCSVEAKTDQIDGPLKWRDTIIHCQAIIEDCEREIERNVQLLDAEGLMMQADSKKAMQHYAPDVDMGDWRNWKKGDEFEVIKSGYEFDVGDHVRLTNELSEKPQPCCEYLDQRDYWWIAVDALKFIRRP